MTPKAYATVEDQDIDEMLRSAYRDLGEGALDRAECTFQRVLDEYPADRAKGLNGLGIVASLLGRIGHAIGLFRKAIEAVPDYAAARENLANIFITEGQRHFREGRLDNAAGNLEAARELVTGADGRGMDEACRTTLGQSFYALGRAYRDRPDGLLSAIDCLRHARGFMPEDSNLRIALDTALSATQLPAMLSDYTDRIDPSESGKQLLIACFPKSGSTFLKSALMEATGFPEQNLAFSHGQNETTIYLPDLIDSAAKDTVTQLHVRASDSNLRLLQAFAIRPVILVRNIFDVLLSYKEFHDRYAKEISYYDTYDSLDEQQRFDLIVDDRAAWYIGFFAGWQRAVRSGRIDGLWLTYEELIQDKVGKLEEILQFYGLDQPREAIAQAVERSGAKKVATHFNKGVAGRGEFSFTDEHRAQIKRIAGYHPDIDFSLIGL